MHSFIVYLIVWFRFFRYPPPAERFVPIVSPDDGYDGHYDRCDDAYVGNRKDASAYARASSIVDTLQPSSAALSRAYATATMRPSNRCCAGSVYSSGGGGVTSIGCGGYQYATGRTRSPRDLSPTGLVRHQTGHLSSSTGSSPPKGPNSNSMCLLQYDSHTATLPRCGSANIICSGPSHFDGHRDEMPAYGNTAPRRISTSCIRESAALACCPSTAGSYSGQTVVSKNATNLNPPASSHNYPSQNAQSSSIAQPNNSLTW